MWFDSDMLAESIDNHIMGRDDVDYEAPDPEDASWLRERDLATLDEYEWEPPEDALWTHETYD